MSVVDFMLYYIRIIQDKRSTTIIKMMIKQVTSLITTALLMLLAVSMAYAEYSQFSFARPFSGDKVNNYEIQLEFKNNEIRHYHIPDDCIEINNQVTYGAANPVNIIDRKVWFKAINDCKYVMMMQLNETRDHQHDFVSDYDFFNARLEDLPFASTCDATDPKIFAEQCANAEPGKLTIRSFFPFLEIIPAEEGVEYDHCRFTDGIFRGRLVRTREGIRCQQDRRANGLRLVSVDHSDFNRDGYRDALLRIIPLGRGISRFPIMLPLTRYDAESPFSVSENIRYDYRMNF